MIRVTTNVSEPDESDTEESSYKSLSPNEKRRSTTAGEVESPLSPSEREEISELSITFSNLSMTSPKKDTKRLSRRWYPDLAVGWLIDAETQVLYGEVAELLNRYPNLSAEEFANTLKSLQIDTVARLEAVVELICKQATAKPETSSWCAEICCMMQHFTVQVEDTVSKSFGAVLITKCQCKFEHGEVEDLHDTLKNMGKLVDVIRCEDASRKKQLLRLLADEAKKERTMCKVANCRFIGELFKSRIINNKMLNRCINKLLYSYDEASIDGLSELLNVVGNHVERLLNIDDYLDTDFKTLSASAEVKPLLVSSGEDETNKGDKENENAENKATQEPIPTGVSAEMSNTVQNGIREENPDSSKVISAVLVSKSSDRHQNDKAEDVKLPTVIKYSVKELRSLRGLPQCKSNVQLNPGMNHLTADHNERVCAESAKRKNYKLSPGYSTRTSKPDAKRKQSTVKSGRHDVSHVQEHEFNAARWFPEEKGTELTTVGVSKLYQKLFECGDVKNVVSGSHSSFREIPSLMSIPLASMPKPNSQKNEKSEAKVQAGKVKNLSSRRKSVNYFKQQDNASKDSEISSQNDDEWKTVGGAFKHYNKQSPNLTYKVDIEKLNSISVGLNQELWPSECLSSNWNNKVPSSMHNDKKSTTPLFTMNELRTSLAASSGSIQTTKPSKITPTWSREGKTPHLPASEGSHKYSVQELRNLRNLPQCTKPVKLLNPTTNHLAVRGFDHSIMKNHSNFYPTFRHNSYSLSSLPADQLKFNRQISNSNVLSNLSKNTVTLSEKRLQSSTQGGAADDNASSSENTKSSCNEKNSICENSSSRVQSIAELNQAICKIFDEFFNVHDVQEFSTIFQKRFGRKQCGETMSLLVLHAIHKKPDQVEKCGAIITRLFKSGFIMPETLIDGLNAVVTSISACMDESEVPKLWKCVGQIINQLIYEECLRFDEVEAAILNKTFLSFVSKKSSAEDEREHRSMLNKSPYNDADCEIAFSYLENWLKNNFETTEDPKFVSRFAKMLYEFCRENLEEENAHDQEVTKKPFKSATLLQLFFKRYIYSKKTLEIQFLNSVVRHNKEASYPNGLLRRMCESLYETNWISTARFLEWRDAPETNLQGVPRELLNGFFENLEKAPKPRKYSVIELRNLRHLFKHGKSVKLYPGMNHLIANPLAGDGVLAFAAEGRNTKRLYNAVINILKNLTLENFKTFEQKIKDLRVDTVTQLEGVVDLIYGMAMEKPITHCELVAKMCGTMQSLTVKDADNVVTKSFTTVLIAKCRKQLEHDMTEELDVFKDRAKMVRLARCADPKIKEALLRLLVDESTEERENRIEGNCRFMIQLFKSKMIPVRIVLGNLKTFLQDDSKISQICVFTVLNTIGKELEENLTKNEIPLYFEIMLSLACTRRPLVLPKILLMLQNNCFLPGIDSDMSVSSSVLTSKAPTIMKMLNVERTIGTIFHKFVTNEDQQDELLRSFQEELSSDHYQWAVSCLILLVLKEKSNFAQECGTFVAYLFREDFIMSGDLIKIINDLIPIVMEMKIGVPNVWIYFGRIISSLINEECLLADELRAQFPDAEFLRFLRSRSNAKQENDRIWLKKFFTDCAAKENPFSEFKDWFKGNVRNADNAEFVNTLTKVICELCNEEMADDDFELKYRFENSLKTLKSLRQFIEYCVSNNEELQMQFLNTIVEYGEETSYPKGLLTKICESLYYLDVVSDYMFLEWKSTWICKHGDLPFGLNEFFDGIDQDIRNECMVDEITDEDDFGNYY